MDLIPPLRISSSTEPPFQASKWLSSQALIDGAEMEDLLKSLGNITLYLTGGVEQTGQGILPISDFLQIYRNYVESLAQGRMPEESTYRKIFSPAMSATPEALYTIPAGEGKELIRICKPVVQMQAHTLDYSPLDKKFRSMVFGSHSIPWGIQFSYPQMYFDNAAKKVVQTKALTDYPNTILFNTIVKWMRSHTIPTPFIADETLQNVPMRLGKNCLRWINNHPQLNAKAIKVKTL